MVLSRTSIGLRRSIHPSRTSRDARRDQAGRGWRMTKMPGMVLLIVFGAGVGLLALEIVFIVLVNHGATWRPRTPRRVRRTARSTARRRSASGITRSRTVERDDGYPGDRQAAHR